MIDVVVIGAGPVGTLLSGELARHGVDATVLERRSSVGGGTRAIGVHPAALRALEPSGTTERILADALRVREGEARARGRGLGVVRFARVRSPHPYIATLPQAVTEVAIADAARFAGARPVRQNARAIAVTRGKESVEVRYLQGDREEVETARLVVVAAGARGRSIAGLDVVARARPYPDRYLMSDVPDVGADGVRAVVYLDREGVLESFPLPGGMRRYVAWDRFVSPPDSEEGSKSVEAEDGDTLRDRLRAAVAGRGGSGSAARAIATATSFGVRRALVTRMRASRVFVIGDAAHEVSPIGGQGMNLGLIDAVTLAPLLARWVRDGEPPEDGLRRWEVNRLRAATRAARIAAVNTMVGRPRGGLGDAFRRGLVAAALRSPTHDVLARAYSMGFDPDG